uniref:Uncharacterized protein n=1 Tax=Anopheles atroparvus TaxID=41427 RepID=A0AAG5CS12_ANOAO
MIGGAGRIRIVVREHRKRPITVERVHVKVDQIDVSEIVQHDRVLLHRIVPGGGHRVKVDRFQAEREVVHIANDRSGATGSSNDRPTTQRSPHSPTGCRRRHTVPSPARIGVHRNAGNGRLHLAQHLVQGGQMCGATIHRQRAAGQLRMQNLLHIVPIVDGGGIGRG